MPQLGSMQGRYLQDVADWSPMSCQILALAWAEDLWSLPQTLLLFCVFLYTGSAHLPMRELAADVVSVVSFGSQCWVCRTCVAVCTFPIHVSSCKSLLQPFSDTLYDSDDSA